MTCSSAKASSVASGGRRRAAAPGSSLLASGGMDLAFAQRFAEEWAAAWNSHDLERILAHYTDDVVFASPMIVQLLDDPSGEVRGKDALRAYWAKGLERLPDLHFTVEDVRASVDALVINYRNQRGQGVTEVLTFRAGLVCRGFGAYGAAA
jgi:ketosteroid isomerase-like protein